MILWTFSQADLLLAGASDGTYIVRNDLTNEQVLMLTFVDGDQLIDMRIKNTPVRRFMLCFVYCYLSHVARPKT